MRLSSSFVCCILFTTLAIVTSTLAADLPKPSGEGIVDSSAELELLFTRSAPIEGGLTEGPAVAPDGSIYFSDIPFGSDKGMINRFDPKTTKVTVFSDDSGKTNGLIFDSKGFLLSAAGSDGGDRAVSRWNIKTGKREVLANQFKGKRFNAPNDLCVDSKGNIYFTDPRYVGTETRELKHRAVYRQDPKGKVIEVTHNISKPNGIALSIDEKTLYVADHDNGTDRIDPNGPTPKQGDMFIYAYKLKPDGTAGKRSVLVDFGEKKGCDGMTIDEHGNVYLTVRDKGRPGVMVVSPKGKEVAFIPTGPEGQTSDTPVGLPSNVEFGLGDELNALYVTVDKSLYRIALKVNGYHRQYK